MCCDDLTTKEWERVNAAKGRVLKKSYIVPSEWQCMLDVMKTRLTGASRASDIAVPMLALMNGLRNGTVYDWASFLFDRIHDFHTLQHKAFYMPFHAIKLFLDAVQTHVPSDRHVWKPQNWVDPSQPPIFYWTHLDTFTSSGDVQPSNKRRRQ